MKRISIQTWIYVSLILMFHKSLISKEISNYFEAAKKEVSYNYPYDSLPSQLKEKGKDSLLLFSYGSLIDEQSASLTLSSQALATRRPAVAFGVKRVFNRDVPVRPQSMWGIPNEAKARGMLNVQKTRSDHFINGVLIEIPLNDIPALLNREEGYDLIPVVISDWHDFLLQKPEFEIAYILHADPSSPYTNSNIFPRPGYYELSRNAAKQYGLLFEFIWLKTTYMADGKNLIDLWETWIQQEDPRTKAEIIKKNF